MGPSSTILPAAGSVVYAQTPSATMMPAAGSVTYAAAPVTTYAAPVATYAAPVSTMAYGAPVVEQPVYTISPERFQRIMAGEPLTNEEIAEMTGQAAAPAVVTETAATTYAAPGVTET